MNIPNSYYKKKKEVRMEKVDLNTMFYILGETTKEESDRQITIMKFIFLF